MLYYSLIELRTAVADNVIIKYPNSYICQPDFVVYGNICLNCALICRSGKFEYILDRSCHTWSEVM